MDIFKTIVLGLVQGVTEFLPVSSTGHLIIVRDLLGLPLEHTLGFDAVLQLASALAIIVYFRRDIGTLIVSLWSWLTRQTVAPEQKNLLLALIVGTIPAVILGLFLNDYMDTTFRGVLPVAIFLLIGSLLMYLAERFGKQENTLSVKKGLLIGFFQSLALLPGISRSGATISGGLFTGLTREAAARFSFLLSIPVLVGGGLVKLVSLLQEGDVGELKLLLIGSVFSLISAYFAIGFLLRYLRTKTLTIFIWYRVALALVLLLGIL